MIGRGQLESHQVKERLEEARRLMARQTINGLDGGHRLNRQVGVSPGCARFPDQFLGGPVRNSFRMTQRVRLPHSLSEALSSFQLRMRYVDFFFMAEKAYHVMASGKRSCPRHYEPRFRSTRNIGFQTTRYCPLKNQILLTRPHILTSLKSRSRKCSRLLRCRGRVRAARV